MKISGPVKIVMIFVVATLVLAMYLYRRSVVPQQPEPPFTEQDFASLKVGDVLVDIKGREWVVTVPLHTKDWSTYGENQRLERYVGLSTTGNSVRASLADLQHTTKEIRKKP